MDSSPSEAGRDPPGRSTLVASGKLLARIGLAGIIDSYGLLIQFPSISLMNKALLSEYTPGRLCAVDGRGSIEGDKTCFTVGEC